MNMYTAPKYRKQGIAIHTLDLLVKEAKKQGVTQITLEATEMGRPLYEKYGFQSLGTRKGYYQDNNEDALIMWTENIFYDKFKKLYQKNCIELEKIIKINE